MKNSILLLLAGLASTALLDAQLTTKKLIMQNASFQSEGLLLKGHLYLPPNYANSKSYPAVVVSGSWTTVKEQMAGLQAKKLAWEDWLTTDPMLSA